LSAPWQSCDEDSGLVTGHAPAEAAVDQVFLSFVPFQNPDRNMQRSRVKLSKGEGIKDETDVIRER